MFLYTILTFLFYLHSFVSAHLKPTCYIIFLNYFHYYEVRLLIVNFTHAPLKRVIFLCISGLDNDPIFSEILPSKKDLHTK